MPRKSLPIGEKKIRVTVMVEGKYLENRNLDELKDIAYLSIVKFVKKNDSNYNKFVDL